MIKDEIYDILMSIFDNDEYCEDAARSISDLVRESVETVFHTMLEVRFNGIPQ